jgi:cytochrome b pre-mRNA-processing protein 3
MILLPFRRSTQKRSIAALYGMIVAQARLKAFYAIYGVPDTVEGRFDLLVLHLVLLLRRLARQEGPGRKLGQGLFDAFCRDLDDNLREMGIGDLAVPKRMRRFAEAFYGRQAAYLSALEAPDREAFENALERNIFAASGVEGRAARLARYARAIAVHLDAQEDASLIRGEVVLPGPEAFIHE